MKWLRTVGLVGLFLAMNGIMLGSDPEKRLQVRWSELKKVIRGKKVTLQLADGTLVKGGRVKRVKESSVVLWVKRSSDYPKGQTEGHSLTPLLARRAEACPRCGARALISREGASGGTVAGWSVDGNYYLGIIDLVDGPCAGPPTGGYFVGL